MMSKWATKRRQSGPGTRENETKTKRMNKSLSLSALAERKNEKRMPFENFRWDLTSPAVGAKQPKDVEERRRRLQYIRDYKGPEKAVEQLEPKVYVPYDAKPGNTPRRVAVQRKEEFFSNQDIAHILNKRGIFVDSIITEKKMAEDSQKQLKCR